MGFAGSEDRIRSFWKAKVSLHFLLIPLKLLLYSWGYIRFISTNLEGKEGLISSIIKHYLVKRPCLSSDFERKVDEHTLKSYLTV